MKISYISISALKLTSGCPICNKECETDMSSYPSHSIPPNLLDTLPKKVHFWCIDCDHYWLELLTMLDILKGL